MNLNIKCSHCGKENSYRFMNYINNIGIWSKYWLRQIKNCSCGCKNKWTNFRYFKTTTICA